MAQRRELQEERADVQTRLTQAATKEDAHRRALADIAEAEKTAADLADAAAEQERLDLEVRDAQRQVDRLKDTGVRVQREQAAVDRAQHRLDCLRVEVARAQELEASREPLQTRVETLQQKITVQKTRSTQLYAEMETIEEQGIQLKGLETDAVCPICEQPLSADHRQQLLDRLRQRWKEMDGKAKAAAETIRQAEAEREQARATLAQQEKTLRSLPRQHAVETAETELAEVHAQFVKTHATAEALEQAPQRVEQLQQTFEGAGRTTAAAGCGSPASAGTPASGRGFAAAAGAGCAATKRAGRGLTSAWRHSPIWTRRRPGSPPNWRSSRQPTISTGAIRPQPRPSPCASGSSARQRWRYRPRGKRYESGQEQLAASTREFDEERFQEAVAQVAEIRSSRVRLENDLGHWRERLTRAEEEIVDLRAQAQRLAAARSLHDRLTEQEELLQFLRSVLQEAGPFVTKALVQQISYAANQLFGQIMEDYTRTLHWQEDYGITLEVDGRERAFAQLSGGEQMSAALAVRLALLQEMSAIAVAFFDEPTTNLDGARRDALARQIVGVRGFEQLFIISHDDSFEQATEKLIRVEKRNGASEIHYE